MVVVTKKQSRRQSLPPPLRLELEQHPEQFLRWKKTQEDVAAETEYVNVIGLQDVKSRLDWARRTFCNDCLTEVSLMATDRLLYGRGCFYPPHCPSAWLTSDTIVAFTESLDSALTTSRKPAGEQPYPRPHITDPNFFTELQNLYHASADNVLDASKHALLRNLFWRRRRTDALPCRQILIPVNTGNLHWSLVQVDIDQRMMLVYDSMNFVTIKEYEGFAAVWYTCYSFPNRIQCTHFSFSRVY